MAGNAAFDCVNLLPGSWVKVVFMDQSPLVLIVDFVMCVSLPGFSDSSFRLFQDSGHINNSENSAQNGQPKCEYFRNAREKREGTRPKTG